MSSLRNMDPTVKIEPLICTCEQVREMEVQTKLQALSQLAGSHLGFNPIKEEKLEPLATETSQVLPMLTPKQEGVQSALVLTRTLPEFVEMKPATRHPIIKAMLTRTLPQPQAAQSALVLSKVLPQPQPEFVQMKAASDMDTLQPQPELQPEIKPVLRSVLAPISANTRSKRGQQQKTPSKIDADEPENIKLQHKRAKKSQAKRFRLDEDVKENQPERLELPMGNTPIGLELKQDPISNVENENVEAEAIDDDPNSKGLNGPEAHYSVTLSQISEVLCVAKAITLDKVQSFVTFQEMDREAFIELPHAVFDKLLSMVEIVNSTLEIIKSGASVKSQIYLGNDTFLTLKSKYPATPVDIRKFKETANGDRIYPTREGQCLTSSEWAVFNSLSKTIHQRLLNAEKDVKNVLQHMKDKIARRQNAQPTVQ